MPVVSKCTYQKSVLRGPALAAIAGIFVTGDNYQLAVKLLKDRFGKKEAIIELLYSRLQNLPRSGNSLAQVKSTYDALKTVGGTRRGGFHSKNVDSADNLQISD